jgi:DNA polymerase-3 subunit epsilon
MSETIFDLRSFAQRLRDSGEFRVYERFHPRRDWPTDFSEETRRGVLVDTETTGLNSDRDAVIQLAICPFEYTPDGVIVLAEPCQTWMEDPGRPLDPKIARLTGLTDADLVGQRIDDAAVNALVDPAVLVIAHNAEFDRPFLEKRLPLFAEKNWGCSWKDVPWEAEDLTTQKLEWLVERLCGKFYQAHDATEDCEVLVELLATRLPSDGRRVLAALLDNARQPRVRLWATGSLFDSKDMLKDRGYQFNRGTGQVGNCWYRDLPKAGLADELEWLKPNAYGGQDRTVQVTELGPTIRFSSRIMNSPMVPRQLP